MMNPGSLVTSALLASARSEQETLVVGALSVLLFGGTVVATVFGIKLLRDKRTAPGVVLLVVAALLGLSCFAMTALFTLAQFAWH